MRQLNPPFKVPRHPKLLRHRKAEAVTEIVTAATADTSSTEQEANALKAKGTARLKSIEQALAGRWFVVLGGIAIALGGLLFVKYAHDNGLIPPVLRVIVGYVFAGLLVYGGELVRKKRDAAISDHVPAALSAAGLVIAFGVTYAAYALYGLLSPGVCFPLLVLIGLAALWLSRRQGPLIAALGLVGSYAAPALVPSDHPSAWGFFSYLVVIVVASLYELRSRPWWWLGFSALAGALVWGLLWIHGGLFDSSHLIPASLFAFVLALASTFVPRGVAALSEDYGSLASGKLIQPPLQLALAGAASGWLILASIVLITHHSSLSLWFLAVAMAAICAYGWMRKEQNIAALLAAGLTLIVLIAWPEVSVLEPAFDDRGFWTLVPGLIEPPRFLGWMMLAMAAYVSLGVAGTLAKREPPFWDYLAAASSITFLFAAWAVADFVMAPRSWALIGVVTAAVLIATCFRLRARIDEATVVKAIWALVAACALLVLFAVDRLLDNVWMTLAIAVLALVFGYGAKLFPVRIFGIVASLLATLASVRLFVGREFWSEPAGLPLGAHWPLYGYGVPALLFWLTARLLPQPANDKARISLEGLSLGLLISLVSLELRVLIGGGIVTDHVSLLELSSHAVAWLGAAYGLAYRQGLYSSFISRWGMIGLVGASSLMLVIMLTVRNPAITSDTLEGSAVFNTLWLAYAIPAVLLFAIIRRDGLLARAPWREMLGTLGLALLMMFVTLMVKRAYQGAVMTEHFSSDAENYTVSLAWLVMSVAGFIAGLKLDRQYVRVAGLLIMALTVLKVFIFDFSELGGLWRIASLMGLGFCLVGIGWLYTRFVNKPQAVVQTQGPSGAAAMNES